jgi:hypothetical protein
VSGESAGREVNLKAVNGGVADDAGVEHGARLVAFTEAVMGDDPEELVRARTALRAVLTPEAFVDCCAVIGAFNVVDRIADATGIPIDPMMEQLSGVVRRELDLARFGSSANSPG